jgi:uroporphyrinogen-III synthase
MRGNVDTRIHKVMDGLYDAAVLAAAGLERLGLTEFITEWLPLDIMLPAPGQGALAVQCRSDDTTILEALAMIDEHDVRAAVTAERAFLAELGSGCSAPVAAYASVNRSKPAISLQMTAMVAAPDGAQVVRVKGTGDDAHALGVQLAQEARRQGAAVILAGLNKAILPLPLRGKRIVVTRAHHQAQEFSDKLVHWGATPIVLPAIRIVPMPDMQLLDQAIRALRDFDWVIFTSANGVEIFWQRLAATGCHSSAFQGIRVAAVGPATAQTLRQHGVEPDFVPAEFVSQAVIAGLGDVSGLHILLPRAEIAGREFIEKLAALGAVVTDIPTYRTLPAEMDAEGLAELRCGVDAITFTSASTVQNFVTAVKERALFENTLIACIGPVTAEAARQLGLNVAIMAAEHTVDGLIQSLVTHFERNLG